MPLTKKSKAFKNAIIDCEKLNMSIVFYNIHFGTYYESWKQYVQLIPNVVWKLVHHDFILQFLNSTFQEQKPQVQIKKTLRNSNTSRSDEKGSKQVQL